MDEEAKYLSWRTDILWLLFLPLGCICIGSTISAKAIRILVVSGLFLDSACDCLAECLSMGRNVLVNDESRKVVSGL